MTVGARYQQLAVGVLDTASGDVIGPGDAAWSDYMDWLNAGNAPDPAPPPAPIDREVLRANLIAMVGPLRDAQMALGLDYAGHVWQADEQSQARLAAAITTFQATGQIPADFTWRTLDNVDVPMALADLVALAGAMAVRTFAIWKFSWDLKSQLATADDPSTIDIAAGWPE